MRSGNLWVKVLDKTVLKNGLAQIITKLVTLAFLIQPGEEVFGGRLLS
jgi:hypothetical protein